MSIEFKSMKWEIIGVGILITMALVVPLGLLLCVGFAGFGKL